LIAFFLNDNYTFFIFYIFGAIYSIFFIHYYIWLWYLSIYIYILFKSSIIFLLYYDIYFIPFTIPDCYCKYTDFKWINTFVVWFDDNIDEAVDYCYYEFFILVYADWICYDKLLIYWIDCGWTIGDLFYYIYYDDDSLLSFISGIFGIMILDLKRYKIMYLWVQGF
jgi:hypothetical protein